MIETLSEPLVRKIDIILPGRLGFQLRLAVQFAQCVRKFRSAIKVRNGKILANGKSIFGLLILAAPWKSKLEIDAVGEDAVQAIHGIKEFFDRESVSISLG